jgi:thioredoxin
MKNLLNSVWIFSVVLSLACCTSASQTNGDVAAKAAKGHVVVLTKTDFLSKVFNYEKNPDRWVYEGNKPCIIDFYADWCGPCKKVSPILKDLAQLYKDDIIVYKVDVDTESELAEAFGIQSIPTLLFVPEKGQPQISLGALPREAIVEQIDRYLLGKK